MSDDAEKPKKKKSNNPENVTPYKKGDAETRRRGRPTEPPELKLMRRLTKQELIEVGELVIMGNIATLKKLRTDDRCTVLKGMFISVCLKILRDGDMEKFDRLISRFIGKVKDEVDLTHLGEAPGRVLVVLPSNGREAPK